MENIILSICMIVKNEQRCLERCFKSLIPLKEKIPCEVIVTDTGSTDNSIEIAQKYADKLLHFEWCNDFAAARNVGLEQAKGEWIMVIDADEELAEDITEFVNFFIGEEKHHYNGCLLKLKNCSNAEICNQCESLKEYDGPCSYFAPYRVFRGSLNPRYHGIIHEAVPLLEPTYTFQNIVLYHDGYTYEDKSKREEKGRRNAALLEKQIKQNLHDLRAITHVLREEEVLNKDVYQNLIALTENLMYKQINSMFAPYSFAKVADYYAANDQQEKALKICQDYTKKFTGNNIYQLFELDIRFIQSKCLFEQKQYQIALKTIERYLYLMDKYQKKELDLDLLKTASPIHVQDNEKDFMKHLQIQCYMELKDTKTAGEIVKQIDFEKVTKIGFYNFFVTIIILNHARDAGVSLADYYPILSRTMKSENEELKQSAKQVFEVLQKHLTNLPETVRNAVIRQICLSEEGRQDLKELEEKRKLEKQKAEQELHKVIEDTKKTVRELMTQQNMKEKALDLAKRIQEIVPDDEEIKELIKTLSE